MINNKKLLLAIAMSSLLIGGCTKDSTDGEKSDIVGDEGNVEQSEKFYAPLTGEEVEQEVTQRPIMITVNNHPEARPQSGLASADMVYEMEAEGNVTRFLAVYQSELPEKVGPVRSARSYFINLSKGLDAFYVAHGYSEEAKSMLEKGVVDNINGMQHDGTLFKRSSDRVAPHNSYITSENIMKGAEQVNASMNYSKKVLQAFYEPEDSVKIGTETNQIDVSFGKSKYFQNTYLFNPEGNDYERQSGGVTTKDMLTGEALKLSNVLFFEMEQKTIDSVGRQDINLTSGGNAYVFQNGYMREVKWANKDGIPVAVEETGELVKLVPGQSWIHFVSTSPGLAASVKTQ
ncbi:MAG: DUF3048 domain-containing protein [Lysinibacillus sp.]